MPSIKQPKKRGKVTEYCEVCAWDDIKKKASLVCPMCDTYVCKKCADKYGGECADCPPPYYREIK